MRHSSLLLAPLVLAALAACGGAPQSPPAAPPAIDSNAEGSGQAASDGAATQNESAPPSPAEEEALAMLVSGNSHFPWFLAIATLAGMPLAFG